jgi:hypothetical protein
MDYDTWKSINEKKINMVMDLYIDIDGTIAKTPIEGRYDLSQPIPERIEQINRLKKMGHRIVYYTARGTLTGRDWFALTYDQLKEWGCEFDSLQLGKPNFNFIIDDRSLKPDEISWLIDATNECIAKYLMKE